MLSGEIAVLCPAERELVPIYLYIPSSLEAFRITIIIIIVYMSRLCCKISVASGPRVPNIN